MSVFCVFERWPSYRESNKSSEDGVRLTEVSVKRELTVSFFFYGNFKLVKFSPDGKIKTSKRLWAKFVWDFVSLDMEIIGGVL